MTIRLEVNAVRKTIEDDDADMPVLWYLREALHLKGTKFGCGIGQCGACTVHINGSAVRSCSVRLSDVNGTKITTIEGLADNSQNLHPLQEAWMDIDVPQCGYCQAGQIMSAAAFLKNTPQPSDEEIEEAMTNICRCGSYTRIRKAVKLAAKNMSAPKSEVDR